MALIKAFEEAAEAEAKARQQQVEKIFRDIDGDDSGCIDEGEFVAGASDLIAQSAGEMKRMSADALVRPALHPHPHLTLPLTLTLTLTLGAPLPLEGCRWLGHTRHAGVRRAGARD